MIRAAYISFKRCIYSFPDFVCQDIIEESKKSHISISMDHWFESNTDHKKSLETTEFSRDFYF